MHENHIVASYDGCFSAVHCSTLSSANKIRMTSSDSSSFGYSQISSSVCSFDSTQRFNNGLQIELLKCTAYGTYGKWSAPESDCYGKKIRFRKNVEFIFVITHQAQNSEASLYDWRFSAIVDSTAYTATDSGYWLRAVRKKWRNIRRLMELWGVTVWLFACQTRGRKVRIRG